MSPALLPPTTRKVLSLGIVAALGIPGVLDTKQVSVRVDGTEVRDVRTHADTVEDVLARQDVEVSPADRVVPALDAELGEATTVHIERAIRVRVVDQLGRARRVLARVDTVAEVMARVSLPADTRLVEDVPTSPVGPGDVVRVRVPVEVTVVGDDRRATVTSAAATVGELLRDRGVSLDADDRVQPAADAAVAPGMAISYTRLDTREEAEVVVLPRPEETRETDELIRGRQRVVDEGTDGSRRDTYRITTVDRRDVRRELVRSEILAEPRARVIEVGTRVPPPPPPREDDGVWYRLARCESGGRWSYDGAYDGGLQFHPSTWDRWKPAGFPAYAWQASAGQQIQVGKRLQAARGWSPWPSCARKLGLA